MGGRGGGAVNGSSLKSGEGDGSGQGIARTFNGNKDQLSSAIPPGVRKIVQSLKEVVNNVSESEIYAVLKECNMDPNDTVNRLLNQGTFHEVKSKRDKKREQSKDPSDIRSRASNNTGYRATRTGTERNIRSTQFPSTEPGILPAKSSAKRENGTYGGSSSSNVPVNSVNRRVPVVSSHETTDRLPQPEFSYSSSRSMWGAPGQVSMADVVKLGRPQSKPHEATNNTHPQATNYVPLQKSSESLPSKIPEMNWEHEEPPSHHLESNIQWPTIELPAAPAKTDVSSEEHYTDSPNDEEQNSEELPPISATSRALQEEDSVEPSLYRNSNSYHSFDNDAPEVASSLQQLSLKETLEDDSQSVIIPNHLQVHGQDCSHLSFGSFSSANFPSSSFPSQSLKVKTEETPEVVDPQQSELPERRNASYYRDDHSREESMHQNTSNVSETKDEPPEPSQGPQYSYSYEPSSHLPASFPNPESVPQLPITYINALPSNVSRKPDLPYSPFPITQSTAAKNLSMSEAIRAATISAAQTSPDVATATPAAPALLQQLAMHPFSQPTLPLGHFSNMIGYPFMPQSYTYMPSGFPGNTTYHQSLAAMLPHYKNSVSVSSLPQSPSGYAFASSNSGNAYQPASYDDLLSSQFKETNHLLPHQQSEWGNLRGNAGYYGMQGQSHQQARQNPQVGYPNYYSTPDHQHHHQHQQQTPRDGQPSKQLWQSSY